MDNFIRSFENIECAEVYRKYRPEWSDKLILSIVADTTGVDSVHKHGKEKLAVDIGCGAGQSSRPLAKYFDKVVGVDPSELQVENARTEPTNPENVEYRCGSAEKIPLPDASADLLTGCAVLHMLVSNDIFKEIDRVLKPGGWFVFYGSYVSKTKIEYQDASIAEEVTKCYKSYVDSFYDGVSSEYSSTSKDLFDRMANYEETKSVSDYMDNRHETNIRGLVGFLNSFSGYFAYREKFPDQPDPAQEFKKRLMNILGANTQDDPITMTVVRRMWVKFGRKPQST